MRLEEARGILDMLSDKLTGHEQSVALLAHRLVCEAYEAMFDPRKTPEEEDE